MNFLLYLGTSAPLVVGISSAGHGKAELNLALCCGSPASVKTTSEKASAGILIMLRLRIP